MSHPSRGRGRLQTLHSSTILAAAMSIFVGGDLSAKSPENCDVNVKAPLYSALTFRALKRLAENSDKNAQYEMADRYENGRDVRRDERMALEWYRRAGEDSICHNYVYLGDGEKGRLLDFGSRKVIRGLPEAKKQRNRLESKMPINKSQ